MFKTECEVETIEIFVDGQGKSVPKDVSVAAALLLLGVVPFRQSKVDQSPRAPYCLMGVCAECVVMINDEPSQFACQVTVKAGMRVERNLDQNANRGSAKMSRTNAN